jgi:hypothetical protein
VNPLIWNDLPTIHDVPCVDDSDRLCLEEIGGLLRKHGKQTRFGVALLHQHFPLQDDELLVEHCDVDRRTLTTAPEKAGVVVGRNYLPTVWRFDGRHAQACSYCPTHGTQHAGYKEQH